MHQFRFFFNFVHYNIKYYQNSIDSFLFFKQKFYSPKLFFNQKTIIYLYLIGIDTDIDAD